MSIFLGEVAGVVTLIFFWKSVLEFCLLDRSKGQGGSKIAINRGWSMDLKAFTRPLLAEAYPSIKKTRILMSSDILITSFKF